MTLSLVLGCGDGRRRSFGIVVSLQISLVFALCVCSFAGILFTNREEEKVIRNYSIWMIITALRRPDGRMEGAFGADCLARRCTCT